MKPTLNCEITRDLLPLYVEQLTSPGTSAAVEEHLRGCADCSALHDSLTEPEPSADADTVREVDYFKKVRTVSRARVVAAVVVTLLALAVGLAAKLFWIGSPATREGASWAAQWHSETRVLELRAYTNRQNIAYRGWQMTQKDGAVHITAQRVIPSPLCDDREERFTLRLDDINEVYLFGTLLWQQGVLVFESTLEAYEARTPYVGSASEVGEVLRALYVGDQCGPFTIALQTTQQPYGLRLNFSEPYTAEEAARLNARMAQLSLKLLVLIDNLGVVSWSVPDQSGGTMAYQLDLNDADPVFGAVMAELAAKGEFDAGLLIPSGETGKQWQDRGLKWCADTPAGYQFLCDLLQDDQLKVNFELLQLDAYPDYVPQTGVVLDDPETHMAVEVP